MLTPYPPVENYSAIDSMIYFALFSSIGSVLFMVIIPLAVLAIMAMRYQGMFSGLYGPHQGPTTPHRQETQSDRDWHVRRTGMRLSSVCLWVGIVFLAAGLWRAQEIVGEVSLFDMVTVKNVSPGIVLIVVSFVFYYLASHPRR